MNDLYRQELRLWLNLYLPLVKLLKKVRVGSKVGASMTVRRPPSIELWHRSTGMQRNYPF